MDGQKQEVLTMKFTDSGKLKAVTFSYDDGVTQDIRLIELLNRYCLKCTFNLNSELLGKNGMLNFQDRLRSILVTEEDILFIVIL